jgi:hypothetical protein
VVIVSALACDLTILLAHGHRALSTSDSSGPGAPGSAAQPSTDLSPGSPGSPGLLLESGFRSQDLGSG